MPPGSRLRQGLGGRAASAAGGALALGALAILAYLPVWRAGFVWDDDHFLTQNPLIRTADGLRRFWVTAQATDYWPVTSSSLWLEWRLWGLHAAGYHATNLALHLASALLVWALLGRLRVPGAWLAAALFVVHPVNVESVAWITQRKNLLAMVFGLASVWGYLRAEESFAEKRQRSPTPSRARLQDAVAAPVRAWAFSFLAFILAMLSKGSVATLPLVLLGLVIWRRVERGDPTALVRPATPPSAVGSPRSTPGTVSFQRDTLTQIGRLLPFFAVAAVLTAVDIWFQRHGTAEVIRSASPGERLLSAAAVVWFYLAKAILPVHLSFCYPQWELRPGAIAGWMPLLALAGAGWALRRWRWALGAFFVLLVPVLGLTDVYFMKYSLVADHYQHLALIAILAALAAGWDRWRRLSAHPLLPFLAAGAALAGCGIMTWRHCADFYDEPTLFRSALRENPDCWMAHNNLGLYLIEHGRYAESMAHCQAAVRLQPDFAQAHNNLGIALAAQGRLPPALAQFREALRLKPNYPEAYNNLGNAFRLQRDLPDAIAGYAQALRLNPDYAEAHNNLGVALMDAGRLPEAIAHLREALRLAPDYTVARRNLGLALRQAGR